MSFMRLLSPDQSSGGTITLPKELSTLSSEFVIATRAMAVALSMYPPGSAAVKNSASKVSEVLSRLFGHVNSITFSETQGMLLVDGKHMDEKDSKRDPVVDFLRSIMERNIKSITYKKGTSDEELIQFNSLLSLKPSEMGKLGDVNRHLSSLGVRNITVDAQVYSAVEEEDIKDELREATKNSVTLTREDYEKYKAIFDDYEQLRSLIDGFLGEFLDEEENLDGVDRLDKMRDIFSRIGSVYKITQTEQESSDMVSAVRQSMARLDPKDVAVTTIDQLGQPDELSRRVLSEDFIDDYGENKSLDLAKAMLDHAYESSVELPAMPRSELQRKVGGMREGIKFIVKATKDRDNFPEIGKKLLESGVAKGKFAEQIQQRITYHEKRRQIKDMLKIVLEDGSISTTGLRMSVTNLEKFPEKMYSQVESEMKTGMPSLLDLPEASMMVDKLKDILGDETEPSARFETYLSIATSFSREALRHARMDLSFPMVEFWMEFAKESSIKPPDLQRMVTSKMAEIFDEEVITVLVAHLPQLKGESLDRFTSICTIAADYLLQPLFGQLKASEDRRVRSALLKLLPQMGPEVISLAKNEIAEEDNEWYVMRNMALLIVETGESYDVQDILHLMDHEDARVRKEVLKGAQKYPDEEFEDVLSKGMNDSDSANKRLAISLLGSKKDPKAVPMLAEILAKRTKVQKEEPEPVQLEAINALVKIGTPDCVDLLIDVATKEGLLGTKQSKPVPVRAKACMALGQLGNPKAKDTLAKAAKDSAADVAQTAKMALQRLK